MKVSNLPSRPNRIRNSHAVQFYDSDALLIADLGRNLHAALERGDAAVVIATEAHRAALREVLLKRGWDLNNPVLDQRYFELDAANTLSQFMADGSPDAALFAEITGRVLSRARSASETHTVFAFGEMVALLWAQGNKEGAIRLERLWNDLAHSHSFSLHCAYPQSLFRGQDHEHFYQICAEHSHLVLPSAGC